MSRTTLFVAGVLAVAGGALAQTYVTAPAGYLAKTGGDFSQGVLLDTLEAKAA